MFSVHCVGKWLYLQALCLALSLTLAFSPIVITPNYRPTVSIQSKIEQDADTHALIMIDKDRISKVEDKQGLDHDAIKNIEGEVKLLSNKMDTLSSIGMLIFGALLALVSERCVSWLRSVKKKEEE